MIEVPISLKIKRSNIITGLPYLFLCIKFFNDESKRESPLFKMTEVKNILVKSPMTNYIHPLTQLIVSKSVIPVYFIITVSVKTVIINT